VSQDPEQEKMERMINAVTRIGQLRRALVSFTLFALPKSLTPQSLVLNQAIEDRHAASE
jgi:hypothetical protein